MFIFPLLQATSQHQYIYNYQTAVHFILKNFLLHYLSWGFQRWLFYILNLDHRNSFLKSAYFFSYLTLESQTSASFSLHSSSKFILFLSYRMTASDAPLQLKTKNELYFNWKAHFNSDIMKIKEFLLQALNWQKDLLFGRRRDYLFKVVPSKSLP